MIHHVQVLRFVAAAGVLIGHSADLLIAHDPAHRWFWAVPWTAGVDLFFVVSGFIMLLLTRGSFGSSVAAIDFLKRRAIRIVPPYWFFTIVTIALFALAGGRLKHTTFDLPQILTSFGFIPWPRIDGKMHPIVAQGWTLNFEAFFYVAFAAALCFRRGVLILCGVFVVMALSHDALPDRLFVLKFWTRPIILEFVAGIGLACLYLNGIRLRPAVAMALGGLAMALFIIAGFAHPGPLLARVLPAFALSASFALAPEPHRIGPAGRLLHAGGDASYTLYLSHWLIVNGVAVSWQRLGGPPWVGVLLSVVCSLGFAVVSYRLVERPSHRYLQRHLIGRVGDSDGGAP